MKQAWPQMTPAQAKDILKTTARDVTKGRCAQRTGHHRAGPGADLATGHGIADATKATLLAKSRAAAPPTAAPAPPLAAPGAVPTNGGQGVEELVLSLAMAQGEEEL
jgi:hypothetical protein